MMGIWPARALILYVMYGEYVDIALQYAALGEYNPLFALLWGMCNPFAIAIESAT